MKSKFSNLFKFKINPWMDMIEKAKLRSDRPRYIVIKLGIGEFLDGIICLFTLGRYEGNFYTSVLDEALDIQGEYAECLTKLRKEAREKRNLNNES